MDLTHEGATWLDQELAGCTFADERLTKRLHKLLEQLEGAMGASLPLACQDWAATKAAYRFFTNGRVSEREILAGHFEATRNRLAATKGLILILHDTTEFTYRRQQAAAIGVTSRVNSGKDKAGRWRMHTVCGLLMHSSLAVTIDGLPLGLAAIKFWSRKKFRGGAALKRRINPTRVPIKARHRIVVRDAKGKPSTARLEIKYQSVQVLPPIGKQRRYPALTLTVICAHERAAPKDREKIDWQLITDLPIGSAKEAVEKLDWYARRWKIELYHKILKSGCRAEDAKLRSEE